MSEPTADEVPDLPEDTTGDPAVDAALAGLAGLDERPTAEHADVYEEVHRRLDGLLRGASAEPGSR